jgi:outer membrane immunogenic protein
MKKLLLASAAMMALGLGGNSAVQAADMPVKAKPIPIFSWTGCYVGAQVGYKWGRSKHTSRGATDGIPNGTDGLDITPWFNLNGGIGGGEAGCQYQWGRFVAGVEVDGSWTATEGQAQHIFYPALGVFDTFWQSKTSERWLATARGRLGYAWGDKWLWYVTGGGAWTGLDINVNSVPGVFPPPQAVIYEHNRGGWVVGWGTEYALAGNWSVKAESLYADFGRFRSHDFVNFPANCGSFFDCTNRDVRLREWIWRVGMNYRFGWVAPVVAKY